MTLVLGLVLFQIALNCCIYSMAYKTCSTDFRSVNP